MAKAKDQDKHKAEGDSGGKKPSIIALIVPVALVTLLAGGGGFTAGKFLLAPKPAEDHAAAAVEPGKEGEKPAEGEEEAAKKPEPGRIVRQLSPIVTNLQSPKNSWIRLELSVVLKPEASAEQDIIAVEAGDKVLGLLRTVALTQIDGPSGLLHLREDLTDLLVGPDSMILQVLINSMVVE
jgi:flagellar FliL protein